jgi:hypothetical protein
VFFLHLLDGIHADHRDVLNAGDVPSGFAIHRRHADKTVPPRSKHLEVATSKTSARK